MNLVKVPGKNNKHRVLMYAVGACAWCKMTKQLLKGNGVEYEYVDVDLADQEVRKEIRGDIMKRGGMPMIFPGGLRFVQFPTASCLRALCATCPSCFDTWISTETLKSL